MNARARQEILNNGSQDIGIARWMVILTVRDGIELPFSAFENDPIPPGPPQDNQPRVPPEGLLTYKIVSTAQSIHYGFRAQSKLLQAVVFHRPPN
jgi:hypothetical protein